MAVLKQSVAYTRMVLIVQSADHVTGLTGASPTVTISKAGGAFSALGGTITEVSSGWYKIAFNTTDTNTVGELATHVTATSGDPSDFVDQIQATVATDLATAAALAIVQADTDDIQARLPAALVSGRIDASVGAIAANAITATAIATDAITAAKVADGTIDAATFAAGAINAAAIATDAITAAKIAADAIGASELAPDAVTEIQVAVAAGAVASVTGAVGSVTGSVGSIAAGGITATSFAADAITAAKIAADVGTEIATAVWANGTRTLTSLSALAADIASAVWDAVAASYNAALSMGNKLNAAGSAGDPWTTALPGAYGAGTAGKIVGDNVNATISSRASQASLDVVDDFVDTEITDIRNRLPAALVSGRMDSSVGAMAADVVTAAAIATDAITSAELAPSAVTEIQAAVAAGSVASVVGAVGSVTGNVGGNVTGSVGSVVGAVGSVTAGVTVSDKTGFALSAAAIDAILDDTIGDGTITARQALRVLIAGMAGKLSGAATTTVTIRNLADSADVVVATVDASGNRSAVAVTP